jgi:NodT family efflux transporter outer membrane factor (OMF) lipoprotein
MMSACNPAPKYAKPPVQTPAAFKEIPPEFKEGSGWKIAQPGDDKIRAKWWEIYNDPQLNTLEEQVQVSNQSIASAEAAFRASRALVISARAALAPILSASPAFTNSRTSANTRTNISTVQSSNSGRAVNNWFFPVDVSYTLDFWHRIRNTILVNTYQAQASAADVATALLTIQGELATDYFEIRELDAQRGLLEETVANYRQTLQLTETLFNAGIDSEEDVAQSQTQLDTALAQLTDVGVARATLEHAIATLIGKPASNFALPAMQFVATPPEVPVAVPSTLLERRPDIAANERLVAAANTEIGVVRAAYYPDVTLSGSGGFQAASFTKWFAWPSRFWSIGPQLSEEVFDAGIRRAQTDQARALYDQNVANYRQTVLTAFQAVEDQLSTLRILQNELAQQRTAIGSAQHSLDLSLTRYKTGVDSYLNIITAQNTVLTNRLTELQIRLRQMSASVSLVIALGGGWDNSQIPEPKQLIGKHPEPQQVQPPKDQQPAAAPNPSPLPKTS